jgi:hypothetical protein
VRMYRTGVICILLAVLVAAVQVARGTSVFDGLSFLAVALAWCGVLFASCGDARS